MSIEDRDYMRTIPESSSKKRSRSGQGLTRSRQSETSENNNTVFSRSEQFGVLLAGAVVVALLLAAIL
ncbi:MAG: hypothetical protein CBC35_11045 [Planctomycetes bacterium TMED75]|nr:hypothetical protein [Planctomycetaceae bacterium]OUU90785.1 MAG: hypothetical protein CBC35_11045 [Planctomycetes bacterium TMED75]